MKIIIAGVGKVGSTLTRQLSASGYDITLIDVKQQVLEANVEKYDVMAVLGNCATMETLLQAGVKDADLLIAMTGADELNLLCSMTAHGINPNIHTPTVPTGKSIFAIPHTRTVNIATASQIAFNKYTKNCFTENKRCSIPCL